MKYLCLIYLDERELARVPTEQVEAVSAECVCQTDELERNGQLLACERLQPARTATTVRNGHGRLSITDGPFAETKEQLAGFYLIDANDLNDAIRIASKIPPGRFGSVEVRPVRES